MVLSRSVLFLCGIFLIYSCTNEAIDKGSTRFRFVPSESSGIEFINEIKSTKNLNILNYLYFYNGAGIAAADFNNDDLIDLYFASNMGNDKLYLNKGNFKFEDISEKAGILPDNSWSTGVTIVDINNDGLMDIYVCEVGDYRSLTGSNKLYINQGFNESGIPHFEESAASYNLDFKGLSTQSAFFDYDLDGDLDMFLMNHSVHPNANYGIGANRGVTDSISGDRLYRNDNGRFKDVTATSGIFSGKIGYGLGLGLGDVNNDGYPDIYVGNDFFENDYLYINQHNSTYKDLISSEDSGIGHTSHFSMGVDIADFNNDGFQDILSLDMLPEDLTTYKASGTDYSYQIYHNYLNKGYANQYMQNALQLNLGNNHFSEIAHVAGIAATEWSWAPLFADLDNDGLKDIFITNGILGATNDMDYISFIANSKIQKRLNQGITDQDLKIIEEIPVKKTTNYFYKNTGDYTFQKKNSEWAEDISSFSNGAVYVDLDNDGDLDLVTNNVNEKAFIYENLSVDLEGSNFLKVKFKGSDHNKFGVGARLNLFTVNGLQIMENFPTRGYLSAVPPVLHFGLKDLKKIDSLEIIWPGGHKQLVKNIPVNQTLTLKFNNAEVKSVAEGFTVNDPASPISSLHREYSFKDFVYEPLIPYSQSNLGPSIAVLDFNKDGRDDIFISGDQFNHGTLWYQNNQGKFSESDQQEFTSDSKEPIDQVFFDFDNDEDLDLVKVFGGSDPNNRSKNQPVLYLNKNGTLKKTDTLEKFNINASVVRAADFNNDGFQDLFIGSNSDYSSYGAAGDALVLLNDGKGSFIQDPAYNESLKNVGMVYDARIVDINKDDLPDIAVAGHYMPLTIFLNSGTGTFKKKEIPNTEGWWNTLEIADFDNDGDYDLIAGNWGNNSRLKASTENPLQLYLNDFDDNGKIDPVITYFYQGRETPLATKDELTKQIPELNKSFLSYTDFAKADFNDYFSKEKIARATQKKVVMLETSYFENIGNLEFKRKKLPLEVQFSSVHAILVTDLNEDGLMDLVLGGNNYHVNTQLGRLDAGRGLILMNKGDSGFEKLPQKFYINGPVKSINKIKILNERYLIFGINNDKIKFEKYPNFND